MKIDMKFLILFVILLAAAVSTVFIGVLGLIIVVIFTAILASERKIIHTNYAFLFVSIIIPITIIVFFDPVVAFAISIILPLLLAYTSKIKRRDAVLAILIFMIFLWMYYLQFSPALSVAKGQGTVLSDNWWEALNWINKNTAECAVVATYWDPGHFITGIARRAVVFDGASQGNMFSRPYNYTNEGIDIEKYDNNINHIVLYKNGNKTTARIQDISTTLLTSNETLAVEILKEYRKPGCDEMYYIASADLIPKSTWWTYFATWNPIDKKGTPYVYASIPLGSSRPDLKQNAMIYSYPISAQQSFILYITNETVIMFMQQQGTTQPLKVEKFLIFDQQGRGQLVVQENAAIKGLVYIDPSLNSILFIPPELEGAMFTRMFLFNGNGLKNFELVNNWGGEVKLYRIKFD